jgi:hypothetical protein
VTVPEAGVKFMVTLEAVILDAVILVGGRRIMLRLFFVRAELKLPIDVNIRIPLFYQNIYIICF